MFEIIMLEKNDKIMMMYPRIADDLLSKKSPKSQIMCLIPLSKWYENPRIVKNKINFTGTELIISKKNLKYTSPNDNEKIPKTRITREKFNETPVILWEIDKIEVICGL